ncbi:hypothetical protein RF11_14138 [Thelohanellus kitauei]|uniref:Uncharacterized protein n=1 Tax=Thelohanellus kitauei TaxID=669202 RepID=A0A0C2JXV6_THEKT|nr:hypothetical protein RF11_14138 [Thelohanellus kitauei]
MPQLNECCFARLGYRQSSAICAKFSEMAYQCLLDSQIAFRPMGMAAKDNDSDYDDESDSDSDSTLTYQSDPDTLTGYPDTALENPRNRPDATISCMCIQLH